VEGLSAEMVARYGNFLFRRFRPFVAFEIIQNNMGVRIDLKWISLCTREQNGVYGGDFEIFANNKNL
jgi:hypothetical protein